HERGDQTRKHTAALVRPTQPNDRRVDIEIRHGLCGIEREVPGHEPQQCRHASNQEPPLEARPWPDCPEQRRGQHARNETEHHDILNGEHRTSPMTVRALQLSQLTLSSTSTYGNPPRPGK